MLINLNAIDISTLCFQNGNLVDVHKELSCLKRAHDLCHRVAISWYIEIIIFLSIGKALSIICKPITPSKYFYLVWRRVLISLGVFPLLIKIKLFLAISDFVFRKCFPLQADSDSPRWALQNLYLREFQRPKFHAAYMKSEPAPGLK